jgi:diguanylate cyclase (GGDEF)-like protein/PAS domain S-box-containing protein
MASIFLIIRIYLFKINIRAISNELNHGVEDIIQTSISSLDILAINFSSKPIDSDSFNEISHEVMGRNKNILYLQHKDKGTVTDFVCPYNGNEKTIGQSLLNRKEVADAVNLAIKERKVTVNDPYILNNMNEDIQGVVIRYPIFKGDEFDGFFVAVINFDEMIQKYLSRGIYRKYAFVLRDSTDKIFYRTDNGSRGLISQTMPIKIANVSWSLETYSRYIEFRIFGISTGIFIVLSILGNIMFSRMINSKRRVRLIEELRIVKNQLAEKNQEYELFIDGSNDITWRYDLNTKLVFLSDKWYAITGYALDEVNYIHDLLGMFLTKKDIKGIRNAFLNYEKQLAEFFYYDCKIITRLDEVKWLYIRGKGIKNSDGRTVKLVGSITDVTDRKRYEEKIEYIAYYDTLTNLLNKNYFVLESKKYLENHDFNSAKGALVFIDLDDFKRVNDTLGHNSGDQLLKVFAEVLKVGFRENDLIARYGGDEFLVLMPEIEDKFKIEEICKNVSNMLQQCIKIKDKDINVTASMGIAVIPDDGTDIDVLIKNADTAMYKAKELGKSRYFFFDKDIANELYRRSAIEEVLRTAIEKNELELFFQPQYSIDDISVRGYEVLLRLNSKVLGSVRPDEFIKIAEKTGLINSIGEWVLKKACIQNRIWIEKGISNIIAVNVSPIQFENENFLDSVKNVLRSSKLDPKYLELEITESILLSSYEKNIGTLNELRNMGIKIALDDFGTGYSSIKYLKMLPCNNLKLDKSLIDDMVENKYSRAIVNGIIKLASEINMEVTVEGVETKEQMEVLREMRCEYLQGYLFSKPMCLKDLEDNILKLG